ncbi:hypothetical protein [Neisseria bacilliformis]|jgi:hypothetical protein|uniref:hypothetical protein n=1 Tax=Neisseria bacilliformis TaxID=267212 RepID=UPI0006699FB7|nr:hypothetical protein [Neisseria bacilliformis]
MTHEQMMADELRAYVKERWPDLADKIQLGTPRYKNGKWYAQGSLIAGDYYSMEAWFETRDGRWYCTRDWND